MLDLSSFLGLLSFAIITAITPGPNNLLLAHSGANFGFKRTLPHFFGANVAITIMLGFVYFGAGAILIAVPELSTIFLIISTVYLIYLAMKIFLCTISSSHAEPHPLNFYQAFLFQFVNPKLWMVILTSFGFITSTRNLVLLETVEVMLIMLFTSMPAMIIWIISGQSFKKWMDIPHKKKQFNCGLSILTLLTIPILWLS